MDIGSGNLSLYKTVRVRSGIKASMWVKLVQALCGIILGNLAYFCLLRFLPLPRHKPFQLDAGLIFDFLFCALVYGLVRATGKWK